MKQSQPPPPPQWTVFRTIDRLRRNGIATEQAHVYQETTDEVLTILEQWGEKWAGKAEWQSLLNKKSLQHEVEECIVAIHHWKEWWKPPLPIKDEEKQRMSNYRRQPQQQQQEDRRIIVVDVCCGKALFSMLLSYLLAFPVYQQQQKQDITTEQSSADNDDIATTTTTTSKVWIVDRIVLMDKATDIDWHHIDVANRTHQEEGRPYLELWRGVNLHEYDAMLDRFLGLGHPLALVGIHLCKSLSPALIGLTHGLATSRCPFLLLAPCCLPPVAVAKQYSSHKNRCIPIVQPETPPERQSRRIALERYLDATQKRNQQRQAAATTTPSCYLCLQAGQPQQQQQQPHFVRNCPILLSKATDEERRDLLRQAAQQMPCWNCGRVGHTKAQCILPRATPTHPPTQLLNVSAVVAAKQQQKQNGNASCYSVYCHLLSGAIQQETVNLYETGLTNPNHCPAQKDNWNSNRKSIYIIATS